MQLTEEQKNELIRIVENLDIHPVFNFCEDKVFELEEYGVKWQLQVKITQDEDEFLD